MPELPEVETMRRGLTSVVGTRIASVERVACKLKPILVAPRPSAFRRRVLGRAIVAVDRIGKRVVVRLDSGDAIVFEPRMAGLVLLADPPDEEHLRLWLDLSGGRARRLMYWDRRGLGSVQLLTPRQLAECYGPDKLGPDALALEPDQLHQRLRKSRREIKVALLDQRAVAGIGNLYASEILHMARIHPQRRCDRMTTVQWNRLHGAIVQVLTEAIRSEGSTLSDGTYRTALNQAGGYQNQHRVYDRADRLCPGCGGEVIVRIVQAQRSTFFCPNCQPKRGGLKSVGTPR